LLFLSRLKITIFNKYQTTFFTNLKKKAILSKSLTECTNLKRKSKNIRLLRLREGGKNTEVAVNYDKLIED
jgi:hypothetical protein